MGIWVILWGLMVLCLVAAVTLVAVITCVRCRRPGVLLLLGGILILSVGFSGLLAYPDFQHQTRMWAFMASWATTVLARTLLMAGLVLLVGGVVRWTLARRLKRVARADGKAKPRDTPNS